MCLFFTSKPDKYNRVLIQIYVQVKTASFWLVTLPHQQHSTVNGIHNIPGLMADNGVLSKVHSLSDIELACLLSLISNEHCMISTPADALDDLVTELQIVAERTFGLKTAVVECSPHTTLEEFASSLLLHPPISSPTTTRSFSPFLTRTGHDSYFPTNHAPGHIQQLQGGQGHGQPTDPTRPQHLPSSPLTPTPPTHGASHSQIANIILAKNLDQAPKAVQIQALELLRTHRIFTRTSVQTAPKTFMLVAVLGAESGGEARVTPHLNDFFYVSHWVDPDEEGFARLDGDDSSSISSSRLEKAGRGDSDGGGGGDGDDASIASTASVVKRRSRASGSLFRSPKSFSAAAFAKPPTFSPSDITHLRQLPLRVAVDIDVTRYQMNVVSFLRMHRAVGGGITPQATRHFETLMKSLAALHGLDYVTPALVCLAAKKVYLHRIKMVEPARERSMQWGSELGAIEKLLEGWGPEDVIEEVLVTVTAPV